MKETALIAVLLTVGLVAFFLFVCTGNVPVSQAGWLPYTAFGTVVMCLAGVLKLASR